MFLAVLLHELAHSSLVWYGAGRCASPKIDEINNEAGDYMENRLFGAISSCEISENDMKIRKVGLETEQFFHHISKLHWQS
jgi:hypothetical protein